MTESKTDVLVAIVGAGPGGLLLAAYLQKHLAPSLVPHVKVYETNYVRDTKSHGGSLDLHQDTGLYALKSVGLLNKFQEKKRDGGEEMRVIDAVSGGLLLKHEGNGHRPEIDRQDLRDILIDSLHPDTINFAHHLMSSESSPTGKSWTLTFRVRSFIKKTITAQILIGADGAWSRIRALLTPEKPIYSGVTFVDIQIPTSKLEEHPEIEQFVGRGIAFILSGNGRGLIPQRNGSGILRIYAALRVPEMWWDDNCPDDEEVTGKPQIKAWFEGFNPKVLALLDAADYQTVAYRKIYALPPDLTWSRPPIPVEGKGGIVVLLGDSAHVMSPFAGEGVNLALRDALELGKTLSAILTRSMDCSAVTDSMTPTLSENTSRYLNEGIAAYESLMFRRAKQAGVESAENIDICFDPDSPRTFVEKMRTLLPPDRLSFATVRWFGRTIWSEGWKWAEREGWW
ncbi:FAD/NAD(P)-binding domain-containing protein [Schizopora paradoxa]|uniref:FAD/NAD(P)-binding domain-containing protein n=1 Tax=Schizopora paradoxa TaxID=27342 RepID=A0A0H2RS68_9AGAM|nr:FAD/NAD(P)-binding domain-containing protein [Schizopora paradoxa]